LGRTPRSVGTAIEKVERREPVGTVAEPPTPFARPTAGGRGGSAGATTLAQGPQGVQIRYPEGPASTSMAVSQHVPLVVQSVSR
jgi:hypothetical protein